MYGVWQVCKSGKSGESKIIGMGIVIGMVGIAIAIPRLDGKTGGDVVLILV